MTAMGAYSVTTHSASAVPEPGKRADSDSECGIVRPVLFGERRAGASAQDERQRQQNHRG